MTDHAKYRETRLVREGFVDPETGEVIERPSTDLDERFPAPWSHFREELLGRLSQDPAAALKGLPGYDEAHLAAVQPVRVSRAATRRLSGAAHQDTIRSIGKQNRWLEEGKSAVKTPLTALELKDLPLIVGYDDPRNAPLIAAIRERLMANGDDGMKAFGPGKEPLYKPSKPGKVAPVIKSVNLFGAKNQSSGLSVRGGIANNGAMVRLDLFKQGKKHFVIPVYASDLATPALPSKLVVRNVPEKDWPEIDETFTFMFSLHPGDWVRVIGDAEGKSVREGYYTGFNRNTVSISLDVHDRNPNVSPSGAFTSIGIQTVHALEKYHVDLLGHMHKVRSEIRATPARGVHRP